MFTTKCFKCLVRKNTKFLREMLSDFGYIPYRLDTHDEWLCAGESGNLEDVYVYSSTCKDELGDDINHYIDCGTNDDLFLSISALNDENDYMQWFTNGAEWILCDRQDWMDMYSFLCSGKGKDYMKYLNSFYKATFEEVVVHFKNNE